MFPEATAQPKPAIFRAATATTGDNSQQAAPAATRSVINPRLSVSQTSDDRRELESVYRLGEVNLIPF